MMQQQNNVNAQPVQALVKSAIAGFIATLPMTIFMLATQRFLPKRQQYDLPPEIITKELAHRAHVRWHMSKRQTLAATLVSHFGYGAGMGTLYSPLAKRSFLPATVRGVLFGLVVWAASYHGLLPLIGMSESGKREPVLRNLMMVGAHVIWGAAMGEAASILIRGRS